jgi:hypothetical protein
MPLDPQVSFLPILTLEILGARVTVKVETESPRHGQF